MHNRQIPTSRFIALVILAIFFLSQSISAKQSLLKQFEKEILYILDEVKESIVTVEIKNEQDNKSFSNYYPQIQQYSGIIYQDCYIIIKSTDIKANSTITVELWDEKKLEAEYLGTDPNLGLSVLRIYGSDLIPATISHESDMPAGCWVLIVGNSLGIPRAVSLGMVNCVRNDGIIQIAGNVPAASLGSPIFNSNGEIVGMLSALINPQPSEINSDPNFVMGDMLLADPINSVLKSADKIINESDQPWLGVGADNWPGHIGGVHIRHIVPGSPASKADLQVGDIILGVEGNKWNQTQGMADYIKGKNPGDTLEFEILRGDKKYIRNLQIGAKGSEPFSLSKSNLPSDKKANSNYSAPSNNSNLENEINKLQSQINKLRIELKNQ